MKEMLSLNDIAPIQPPKASKTAYMAVIWSGASVGLSFVVFRLYVRITRFRRLFVDDAFVVLSWLMLLSAAILSQISISAMYFFIRVASGDLLVIAGPDFFEKGSMYLRYQTAIQLLFLSGLWSVKFAFLFFFRTLSNGLKRERILWWSVFAITLATYPTIVGIWPYRCTTSSASAAAISCSSSRAARYLVFTLRFTTSMDVITDVLIMSIPIHLLWKVQISLRRKLLLGGIFSLSLVIILFSILRIALITKTRNSRKLLPEQTWVFLWGYIEASIECSPQRKSVWKRQEDVEARLSPEKGRLGSSESTLSRKNMWRASGGGCNRTLIHGRGPSSRSSAKYAGSSASSNIAVALPDSVHVRHDICISREVHIEPPELQWEHGSVEPQQNRSSLPF
ncbi:MAG: hypothetical protein M1815_001087 [Lichina confinis]|nr:MAG: hypothetical protein M1815_001087 [Lichina confinis]